MKTCTRCDSRKNDDQFYPGNPWCIPCKSEYARQYHAEQREAGPYALMIAGQYIQKIYNGEIVTSDDQRWARPYATYYNANLTRRRLANTGLPVKIIPLRT